MTNRVGIPFVLAMLCGAALCCAAAAGAGRQLAAGELPAGPPLAAVDAATPEAADAPGGAAPASAEEHLTVDYWSLLFVLALSTIIGLGVIGRVSRLLHTPLMSLTNAISAIAVVGSIVVTGSDYSPGIRFLGAVALFASMANIVSGFLITDRMLKMFKQTRGSERQ